MKKAFTLAEVLITLGIIGVVAALTAPALTNNTQQAKIGPTLSKFVSTFENAIESLMNEEGASTIGSLGIDGSSNIGISDFLPNYMIMDRVTSDSYSKLSSYRVNGENLAGRGQGVPYFILKDGGLVRFGETIISQSSDRRPTQQICRVDYDINGVAGPNRFGRDVFSFVLLNNGRLYAYGSAAYRTLFPNDDNSCNVNGTPDQARACTGAIADNNWKADY